MVGLGEGGPPDGVPRARALDVDYDEVADGELLGQGGNADVYLVELRRSGERIPIAVKQPRFQGTLHGDVVDRFREEAEVWAGIDDHDHVVDLVDWGEQPLPWLAMEYMDGGSLQDLLAAGLLPLDQAAWVALCVCRAVKHAHRHGVAHLDLKPANVLFRTVEGAWDVPKVSDWGLARLMLDETGSVEGLSPQYAAPEQFAPDEYGSPDDRTDVYQAGIVAYELFVGTPPFEGAAPEVMRGVLNEEPPPPSTVADVPETVDDAVLPALERDRADRYEDVIYLRDAIEELYEEFRDPSGKAAGATTGAGAVGASGESAESAEPSPAAEPEPASEASEPGQAAGSSATAGTAPTAESSTVESATAESATGTGTPAESGGESSGWNRRSLLKVAGGVGGVGALGAAGLALSLGSESGDTGGGGNGGNGGGGQVGGGGGQTTEPTEEPTTDTGGGGQGSTVRVGVLQPMSGDFGYQGVQSYRGFLSGLALKAGQVPESGQERVTAGDVTYDLLVRDTELSPERAVQHARELVGSDGVDLLFGCASSDAAIQVLDSVAGPESVPFLVGPAGAAELTSNADLCNPLMFRAGTNVAMEAKAGAFHMLQSGYVESAYLIAVDWAIGREQLRTYRRVLEAEGREIVNEQYVEMGTSDWQPLLEEVAASGADALVARVTPREKPPLVDAYLSGSYEFRLLSGFDTRRGMGILGEVMLEHLGSGFTPEEANGAGIGPFTTPYHWNQYDSGINEEFVAAHVEAFGTVPDRISSGPFTAASALHQAVADSGSTDGATIAEALRGMTVDMTPKGEGAYAFQSFNNQARSPVTLAFPMATTEEWRERWQAPVMPAPPDAMFEETTLSQDAESMSCSL